MADKGAVAKDLMDLYGFVGTTIPGHPNVGYKYGYSFPHYAATHHQEALAKNGRISGTVLDGGTPVANCAVLVFWRPTMACAARVFTGADGTFSVSGLDPSKTYTVLAKDPIGGTQYNDKLYALVQPETV